MIRKNLLLPRPLDERIKQIAARADQSEAQAIRDLLEAGLRTHRPQVTIGRALLDLVEIGKRAGVTGPTDLSENTDKYLYDK